MYVQLDASAFALFFAMILCTAFVFNRFEELDASFVFNRFEPEALSDAILLSRWVVNDSMFVVRVFVKLELIDGLTDFEIF